MEKEKYFISSPHWFSFLSEWVQKEIIFGPISISGVLQYQLLSQNTISSVVYGQARAVQPLKWFLFPPIEKMNGRNQRKRKSWVIIGVKACDLHALQILDLAFAGLFPDPHYWLYRENTFLVATDCTSPWDSCFCTEVGGSPFPIQGFDWGLSEVPEGFVVEIGTEKGREKLVPFQKYLKTPSREILRMVEENRRKVARMLSRKNRKSRIAKDRVGEFLYEQWNSSLWNEASRLCVECGMCNHACPTCHCYFLDDVTREKYIKLRGWDACMYGGYAVMAGGATPRPFLYHRFRNRYLCKFKYLKENYGVLGCTGCGRCIEGCQGKIDMRKILSDAVRVDAEQEISLVKIK